MRLTLLEFKKEFPDLFPESFQPESVTFEALSSPLNAKMSTVVFLASPQEIAKSYEQGCRAFVIPHKLKSQFNLNPDTSVLFTSNLTLALACVSDHFFPDRANQFISGIHPTAVIDPTAHIAQSVRIGAHVVIGPQVRLEENVSIGPNSVLEAEVTIGQNTAIEGLVFIGRRTIIGKDCVIKPNTVIGGLGFGFAHNEKGQHFQIPQTGRVVLGDRVQIGAGCTIDRATFDETRIDEGTKMDNICHIAHNTQIGKNCLLAGKFATAGSVIIGDNFMCGGRVSITDHVTVCSNVQIAGVSAVNNDIRKPGVYGGHPLQPIKDYLKTTASLPSLPQLRRDVTRIFSKLGISRNED